MLEHSNHSRDVGLGWTIEGSEGSLDVDPAPEELGSGSSLFLAISSFVPQLLWQHRLEIPVPTCHHHEFVLNRFT